MGGCLIVSLDFELFWGMLDKCPLSEYEDHVLGGREAIPRLLDLFERYDIHATWATVGCMFAGDRQELEAAAPPEDLRPSYARRGLDPYALFPGLTDEERDPCFFAPSLIARVAAAPGQEIGSHTFCHYYCREPGQTGAQFAADLRAAKDLAARSGYSLSAIVLPRNQCREDYLPLLRQAGFTAYRDEENDWIHRHIRFRPLLRALRLLDVYLPLTGQGGYVPRQEEGVWNLMGSRMYKPIFPALGALEGLKMRRIKAQMRHAAKKGLTFHLWWHPHNIGVDTQAHLKQLEELFSYFDGLRREYGMVSRNMAEAAAACAREGRTES